MKTTNPFTPGFGATPRVPVGRAEVLDQFERLFHTFTVDSVFRAVQLRAHRGAGKTVLLNQIQDLATSHGWWVIQDDAGAGEPLVTKLINHSLERLSTLTPKRERRRVSSITVMGAGVGLEPAHDTAQPRVTSLRDVLTTLARAERNGVLVTVDEAHHASDAMIDELGNAIQHLHREGLPIVIVLAGLATSRRKAPTFLARAWAPPIGKLTDAEVETGLIDTAATEGGTFELLALRRAVEAVAGEPYLLQLVGYHAWQQAKSPHISRADVNAAVPPAVQQFVRAVTEQMVREAAPQQQAFLRTMARLGTPTRMLDIRTANDWNEKTASVLRTRLLATGLIVPAGHGHVAFALPGTVDALAELEA